MLTAPDFRDRVEAFLIERRIAATRFGIDAVKDPAFVFDLRKGRVPSLDMASRVLEFMDGYRAGPDASRSNEGAAA